MTYREAEKEIKKLANGRSFFLDIEDFRQRGLEKIREFRATMFVGVRTVSGDGETWEQAINNLKKDMGNI